MAGLLGDGWDDPQSAAIMQLAGGLLSGNFGQGAAAYGATMAGAKDAALSRQFKQAQMDNYASEIEARKLAAIKDQRMQSMVQSLFGTPDGTAAAPSASGAVPGAMPGAPAANPAQTGGAPAAGGLIQLARQLGIPEQAIQADMVFNGGKKISELLAERSKPNWQNVNGNLVNTSAPGFTGGLQGGMSSSADGKVTAWQPDGKGGLVVGAPAGALDTYRAYQGAGAAFKPMKVYNPVTGRDEFTTEGAVVDAAAPWRTGNPTIDAVAQTESGGNPNAVSPKGARGLMQVMPGTNTAPGFGVAPARDGSEGERTRVGQDYLGAMQDRYKDPALAAIAYNWGPGNTDMWLKSGGDFNKLPAETKSYVAQVLTRSAVNARAPQSGNYAAGPSAQEAAQAEANKTRLVKTAEADVVRDTTDKKQLKSANEMLSDVTRAKELLRQGPTASGIGETADKVVGYFGGNLKGADIAAKLDIVAGSLTKNVPRMEGPQSNTDLEEYKTSAGRVANRSLPIEQRLAAADEVERLQRKYIHLNGGAPNTGGATGSFGDKPKAQTFDAKPPAAQFKGKFATGPDGKRYQSDGMIWKEVN